MIDPNAESQTQLAGGVSTGSKSKGMLEYEVVIPVKDGETSIAETIRSVYAQTVRPSCITVVDDGSGDETPSIVLGLGVRLIRQAHEGVSAARNRGLNEIGAPLGVFLDADDLLEPNFAERQLSVWNSEFTSFSAIGTYMQPFGRLTLDPWQGPPAVGGLRALTPLDIWQSNPLTCSSVMFRVESLRAIGGWRDNRVEDYDLLLRLVQNDQRVGVLRERLVSYRVQAQSRSSDLINVALAESSALDSFYESDFRRSNLPSLKRGERLRLIWWRTVARSLHAAPINRTALPTPDSRFSATPTMRLAGFVLRSHSARTIGSIFWRLWRSTFKSPRARG